jgi:hypothetical protein
VDPNESAEANDEESSVSADGNKPRMTRALALEELRAQSAAFKVCVSQQDMVRRLLDEQQRRLAVSAHLARSVCVP